MSERRAAYTAPEGQQWPSGVQKALRITEAMLLAAVRDFLAKACRGSLFYHTWRSDHSAAGFPDVVAVIGSRLVFAELKRDGKEPTPAQQRWLEALARCHTIEVYVWHGSDLDHARDLLSGAYIGESATAAVPIRERLAERALSRGQGR